MGLLSDETVSKLPPRDSRLGQTTGPISSLNEAWLHTLDRCAVDAPLSELILPLMRNCFFGGAMHGCSCCRTVMAIGSLPILPALS
jgi:hypothetical protein